MPTLTNCLPAYRLHKVSKQAVVTINYKMHYLGPFGSKESRQRYNALMAEYLAKNRQVVGSEPGLTIEQLVQRFLAGAEGRYAQSKFGKSSEQDNLYHATRPLIELYGQSSVREMGPNKLRAIRSALVRRGLRRQHINRQVHRIRQVFKWAVSHELAPNDIYQRLLTVERLRPNEEGVKDSSKVLPVSREMIDAVLPHLNDHIRVMVQVQLATAMRPAEVCQMRLCDIDTRRSDVWLYRPAQHKNKHRGHSRVIPLNQSLQELLTPFLRDEPEAYLFSPAESEQRRRAKLHATRATPLSSGNVPGSNKRRKPTRSAGTFYTVSSYRQAIQRACLKAFPLPPSLGKVKSEKDADWRKRLGASQVREAQEWINTHRFHPHQIRHLAATEIRSSHGAEKALLALGDKCTRMADLYAEKDLAQLIPIMMDRGLAPEQCTE